LPVHDVAAGETYGAALTAAREHQEPGLPADIDVPEDAGNRAPAERSFHAVAGPGDRGPSRSTVAARSGRVKRPSAAPPAVGRPCSIATCAVPLPDTMTVPGPCDPAEIEEWRMARPWQSDRPLASPVGVQEEPHARPGP